MLDDADAEITEQHIEVNCQTANSAYMFGKVSLAVVFYKNGQRVFYLL